MIYSVILKIIKFIDIQKKNDLIKVFSFTGIATLVKFFTGFISNKFLSVIIGPSGIALVGQLSNIMYIAFLMSTAGIQSGVVKYVSEYKENKEKLIEYIQNALILIVFCSVITALLIISLSGYLANIILYNNEFYFVFLIYGVTIILFAINSTFLSIINGLQQFDELIKLNITQSINSLIFSLVLVLIWGIEGVLIAIVTNQSIILVFSYNRIKKLDWFKYTYKNFKLKTDVLKNYFKYTLMGIAVSVVDPTSKLIVRNFIIQNFSLNDAGLWEAMNRFSSMYLLIFTSTLGIYMIPKLSETKNSIETKNLLINTYKVIIPTLFSCILLILLLKDIIIPFVFSNKFTGMNTLFLPQLSGDFFFIINFILSSILMAKTKTKLYIFSISLYFFLFAAIGIFLGRSNGICGVTLGYTITNVIFFFYYLFIFRDIFLVKEIKYV